MGRFLRSRLAIFLVYWNECVTDRFLGFSLLFDLILGRRDTEIRSYLLFFLWPVLMDNLFGRKPLIRLDPVSFTHVRDEVRI